MVGINFADTIVIRRVANKGTKIIEEPVKPSIWTGKEFKQQETARLKLAGDLMLMSAKGTKRIRLSDMEETSTPDPTGHYITTGKGTGRIRVYPTP